MDINKLLHDTLAAKGCTIETSYGIWYVTTPEGDVWDMTVPMQRSKSGYVPLKKDPVNDG